MFGLHAVNGRATEAQLFQLVGASHSSFTAFVTGEVAGVSWDTISHATALQALPCTVGLEQGKFFV